MLTVSSISLLSSVFCLQAIFRQRWSKFSANVSQLAEVADFEDETFSFVLKFN